MLQQFLDQVRAARMSHEEGMTEPGRGKTAMMGRKPKSKRTPLDDAWKRIGNAVDARSLFREAGYEPEEVEEFYEALRASPEVRRAFENARETRDRSPDLREQRSTEIKDPPDGRFRIVSLWLEDFKNLRDFSILFNADYGVNILLGWNGTGKSNLFEALVIIFRDLHDWKERNRWPDDPIGPFRLVYELDDHLYEVLWKPGKLKRPSIRRSVGRVIEEASTKVIRRDELHLPRFVFGYYAGPTNRLADHFMPMKQAHYDRLREAPVDDAPTLAALLEKRRFFCAETHHAKYVLLAFSFKEDSEISDFLSSKMRIAGFESALFVVRKPRWAKTRSRAKDFWGATGIMRRVMERLRQHSIASMVLQQRRSAMGTERLPRTTTISFYLILEACRPLQLSMRTPVRFF